RAECQRERLPENREWNRADAERAERAERHRSEAAAIVVTAGVVSVGVRVAAVAVCICIGVCVDVGICIGVCVYIVIDVVIALTPTGDEAEKPRRLKERERPRSANRHREGHVRPTREELERGHASPRTAPRRRARTYVRFPNNQCARISVSSARTRTSTL